MIFTNCNCFLEVEEVKNESRTGCGEEKKEGGGEGKKIVLEKEHRKNCETALFKVGIVENVFCRKGGKKEIRK